jgi:RNA recognition motif-containing protein
MMKILELFKTQPCSAWAIFAGAFVLGMVAMWVLGKVFCPCRKKGGAARKAPRKNERSFEKRHPQPTDGSIEIYVGNLSYDLTEALLRKEFEAYGKVNSARIITHHHTNRSKGFGFVQMPNADEAAAAVKALNDKEILGRKLKCNEAKNVG